MYYTLEDDLLVKIFEYMGWCQWIKFLDRIELVIKSKIATANHLKMTHKEKHRTNFPESINVNFLAHENPFGINLTCPTYLNTINSSPPVHSDDSDYEQDSDFFMECDSEYHDAKYSYSDRRKFFDII